MTRDTVVAANNSREIDQTLGATSSSAAGTQLGPVPSHQLIRYFGAIVFAGFVLIELWEMVQMSAYAGMDGLSWKSTLSLCTWAAAGDVGIILLIYTATALTTGDFGWGLRARWSDCVISAFVGLACAALLENLALAAGLWRYADRMPVVAMLGAGLWPLLQMVLLPTLIFLIARWWSDCSAPKEHV